MKDHYYFMNHVPCRCGSEKPGWTEITEMQYNACVEAIRSFDLTAPAGKYYRLEIDGTWKLHDLPVLDAEISDSEALAIIAGGGV